VRITFKTSITAAVKTRGWARLFKVAVAPTLSRDNNKPSFSSATVEVFFTQIRPAFQSSGTLKVTLVLGFASQLYIQNLSLSRDEEINFYPVAKSGTWEPACKSVKICYIRLVSAQGSKGWKEDKQQACVREKNKLKVINRVIQNRNVVPYGEWTRIVDLESSLVLLWFEVVKVRKAYGEGTTCHRCEQVSAYEENVLHARTTRRVLGTQCSGFYVWKVGIRATVTSNLYQRILLNKKEPLRITRFWRNQCCRRKVKVCGHWEGLVCHQARRIECGLAKTV